jgi:ABC-type multidrug transport system fused ATPase/permease subunit
LLRQYIDFSDASRKRLGSTGFTQALLRDTVELVDNGFIKSFDVAASAGRAVCLLLWSANSFPALLPLMLMLPCVMLIRLVLVERTAVRLRLKYFKAQGHMLDHADDVISNLSLVRDFQRRPIMARRMQSLVDDVNYFFNAVAAHTARSQQVIPAVSTCMYGLVMALAPLMIHWGGISTGVLLAALTAMTEMGKLSENLFSALIQMQLAVSALLKVSMYMNLPTDVPDRMLANRKQRERGRRVLDAQHEDPDEPSEPGRRSTGTTRATSIDSAPSWLTQTADDLAEDEGEAPATNASPPPTPGSAGSLSRGRQRQATFSSQPIIEHAHTPMQFDQADAREPNTQALDSMPLLATVPSPIIAPETSAAAAAAVSMVESAVQSMTAVLAHVAASVSTMAQQQPEAPRADESEIGLGRSAFLSTSFNQTRSPHTMLSSAPRAPGRRMSCPVSASNVKLRMEFGGVGGAPKHALRFSADEMRIQLTEVGLSQPLPPVEASALTFAATAAEATTVSRSQACGQDAPSRSQAARLTSYKFMRRVSTTSDNELVLHSPLKNVSLQLTQGKMYAVVGHHSSGKSSLLRLIGKAVHPSSGEVFVPPHLSIVHVEQDPQLLRHMTLFDNLTLGFKHSKSTPPVDQICAVCSAVGLGSRWISQVRDEYAAADSALAGSSFTMARVKDIDIAAAADVGSVQVVEAAWQDQMSATDRRIVHLARALITNPHILVLHRPLASFDEDVAAKILGALRMFIVRRSLFSDTDPSSLLSRTVILSSSTLDEKVLEAADDVIMVGSPPGGATLLSGSAMTKSSRETTVPRRTVLRRMCSDAASTNYDQRGSDRVSMPPSRANSSGEGVDDGGISSRAKTNPIIQRFTQACRGTVPSASDATRSAAEVVATFKARTTQPRKPRRGSIELDSLL